jgi:hypothetical protein
MVQPALRGIRMTYINSIATPGYYCDSHAPLSLSRGIRVIVDWPTLVSC